MGKNRKILIVSPVPSHPQNAGNRARIYAFCENLREMGCEVYYAYIQVENGDDYAMQKYWGDRLCPIPYKNPKRWKRLDRRILRKMKSIFGNNAECPRLIDDWYDNSINRKLIHLSKLINPEIVIIEYVFFSKALDCFDEKIIKIIDTQDLFADRKKLYLKNNQPPAGYSTTQEEEDKGLCRADIVIAIQKEEADLFCERLQNKKVVTVGHPVSLYPLIQKSFSQTLVFIGSDNSSNIHGINYFIREVFPKVKSKFKDARLILAGRICDQVELFDGGLKLGEVKNLKEVYDLADIVIVPIVFGTGLKIKTVEALGYSKALITTPAGAKGLEDGAGKAFLVAESTENFVELITQTFSDEKLRETLSQNAFEFSSQWNQNCLKALKSIIHG